MVRLHRVLQFKGAGLSAGRVQQLRGQPDMEDRPPHAIRAILGPDPAAVRLDKAATDRQAQADAAAAAFCPAIHLVETIKNTLGQMRRKTRPINGHAQIEALAGRMRLVSGADLNAGIGPAMTPCVLQQITEHHLYTPPVNIQERQILRYVHAYTAALVLWNHLLYQCIQTAEARVEFERPGLKLRHR